MQAKDDRRPGGIGRQVDAVPAAIGKGDGLGQRGNGNDSQKQDQDAEHGQSFQDRFSPNGLRPVFRRSGGTGAI